MWQGHLFGTSTSNALDHLVVDRTTSERARRCFTKGICLYRSDHRALGVELDLSLSLVPPCRYASSRKPIGWNPKDPDRVS